MHVPSRCVKRPVIRTDKSVRWPASQNVHLPGPWLHHSRGSAAAETSSVSNCLLNEKARSMIDERQLIDYAVRFVILLLLPVRGALTTRHFVWQIAGTETAGSPRGLGTL